MKPPSPEIVKAALSLPIEAKRALMVAAEGQPGWLAIATTQIERGYFLHLQELPMLDDLYPGRAFLPCSEVAWMMAFRVDAIGYTWDIVGHGCFIRDLLNEQDDRIWTAHSAPECVLKAWGAL